MAQLGDLTGNLPTFKESRMVTNGFCLWLAWKGDINPALQQTLSDYGGMRVREQRNQALWFFFSEDVFLALARLEIWARLNPIPVFIEIFPAKLLLGLKLEVTLSFDTRLANQTAIIPEEFEAWLHPKAVEGAKRVPGLDFKDVEKLRGLPDVGWKALQADPRLPYQSSMGWFLVLKPLGNPLDKEFQVGWRAFFQEIEYILKRLKLNYILHDFFLMFPLQNLRQLRTWCRDYLTMVPRVKEAGENAYWPCVQAIVDRKGLNFNNELAKKVPLDWDMLMPDFPYMSYRNAFLMGTGYRINDVRFKVDSGSIDDWCNVALSDQQAEEGGAIVIELSKRLVAGEEHACFYCGLRGHKVTECPSRDLEEMRPGAWAEIAKLDFDGINAGFRDMDAFLAKYDSQVEGITELLQTNVPSGHLAQAVFEINLPVQHRMMTLMWRSHGKDYPVGLRSLDPQEPGPLYDALDNLYNGEVIACDRIASQLAMKGPRDFRPRTLQGFSAVEKGDLPRAQGYWREAEGMSASPLHQSYHIYLQARALEMQGRYQQANTMYKRVITLSPKWLSAIYRQGVCLVKLGFAEQAMGFFENLINQDPNMFNRTLIDPELERGHFHLLGALHRLWNETEAKAKEERQNLEQLRTEVAKWFSDDHEFARQTYADITNLNELMERKNYVPYHRMMKGRANLAKDLQSKVEEESKKLKNNFSYFMDRLKEIRREAAWFPFPRVLVEFNREFNFCAKNVNWALKQHFQVADAFRRGQELFDKISETIERLESRLKTLKVVRDSTLFLLIMGKTFFWLELGGLLLALIVVPLAMWWGQKQGYPWATSVLLSQKWEIQKGMIAILSIVSLAVAVLRSALVFDKKKQKLFERYGGE
ncbi:MAG: tetratricopeptide repeat protein [Desulfovibrionaceae bacterium]|jgi:tetratricopeptide (TPR) repeat protein|nr:tetratricopeptide repeat protein [Desulfovibrionaceae bacterium]